MYIVKDHGLNQDYRTANLDAAMEYFQWLIDGIPNLVIDATGRAISNDILIASISYE